MHARPLLQVARAGPARSAALILLTAGSALCAFLLPNALAHATDTLLAPGEKASLWPLAALLTGAVLATAGANAAEVYCSSDATGRLRLRLLSQILALGVSGGRRFAAGDLAGRAVTGASQAGQVLPLLVRGAAHLVMSVAALAALWLIDWRLAVTVAATVPVGLVLMRLFLRRATDLSTRYQQSQGEISSRMLDALAGARTIRGAGTWRREADRVLAPLPELAGSGLGLWRAYGRMQGQGTLLIPFAQLSALAVAGHGVLAGRISPGQMVAVAGYVPMALGLIGQLSFLLRLAGLRAGAARLTEVLSLPVDVPGELPLPPGPGELTLRAVTVRGPDGPLLDRADLTVPAGRTLAIVGPSGAGKTTLAWVAGGLVTPDEGSVHLDGVPLARLSPAARKDAIAYAFERPELLGATVEDAIAYGHAPSRPQIERALTQARADHFVRLLPHGLATALHEAPMSGGEAQRLGLARALVRDARVLICDDATSSLDSVTEAQVEAALADAARSRTRLVVTHRAGTAARADLVAWVDGGRVRAVAPHRDLWNDPAYRGHFAG